MSNFPGESPPPVPVTPLKRRALIIALLLVAAAVAGMVAGLITRDGDSNASAPSAGSLDESAATFIREVMDLSTSGQGGRLYDRLHPAQQALLDRDDMIERGNAELAENPELRHVEIEVTETYPESIRIPCTGQHADITALVVEMHTQGEEVTETMYVDRVDGDWRWINTRMSAVADCELG